MIRHFSRWFKPFSSWMLLVAFYIQMLFPFGANGIGRNIPVNKEFVRKIYQPTLPVKFTNQNNFKEIENVLPRAAINNEVKTEDSWITVHDILTNSGPAIPEATSFKAVGADKLVNLFTGDFSYSIPLLDVGGYPVNLFYNGGITMEQEASWVGLGWNINPGSVTRNMRGVPDDFDGTDTLIQEQNVKPNRTWGGEIGVDGEVLGIKKPKVNFSLGFSYNNYLGPELSLGAGGSVAIATIETFKSEKSAPDALLAKVNLNAKLSSRSGLTFSPSLNANLKLIDNKINTGIGLNTNYNSRTGIRALNVYSEMSYYTSETSVDDKGALRTRASQGGIPLGSSTISFARPTYIPVLRMPLLNTNFIGQLELGAGIFGLREAATAVGFYTESAVPKEWQVMYKPLVGYIHLENAENNKNAVMDFNRLNDGEVTPNTPVISAPQYTYDIFTIQGEGTGGSVRAYRGDMGFVRDNETTSKDKNNSIGVDIAPPGHYGGNWNSVSTPTRVGGWEDANNMLKRTITFEKPAFNSDFENVYYKNPGESTVDNQDELDRVGRDNLVRFLLTGSKNNVRVEPKLEQFAKHTLKEKETLSLLGRNKLKQRSKRSQVISMLTAEDASVIGLEKDIRNYSGSFDLNKNIIYQSIPRVDAYRKRNHISEIDITEQNGMRYIYGIPVYNTVQKDFTFSVAELQNTTTNLVNYASDEMGIESHNLSKESDLDGYVQIQQTPAYASSFLLTGLLSPDYIDVTGDGITEDDIGSAVKFNYSKSESLTKWRTPRSESTARSAHFNEGTKTEIKDNKATVSYGERESWYLSSIESNSLIAIFKTDSRHDAKGVIGESDGRRATENVNKKLTRIDLYTKAEIKSKGVDNAVPVKSVYFQYDYSLCKGVPGNDSASGGKLTLKSIYFTYNGQSRQSKDKYVFGYNESSLQDNPSYAYLAADKWGTYKSPADNPPGLSNIDFPYTDTSKSNSDNYAGAWSLKKILLPSGGQINVQYEADDYGYVQNKRACNMFGIEGLGNSKNYSTNNTLYNGTNIPDNFYVYIHLPRALESTGATAIKNEIAAKYLDGMGQLCFRLLIQMPKGPEYLTIYAEYDDFGVCDNSPNRDYIYIHLKSQDGKSPLATSAIGFLTDNLPGQAFPGYDVKVDDLSDFLNLAGSMLSKLKEAFTNVDGQMRQAHKARLILPDKSFVRLDNPERIKYGGGIRVKRITYNDNWNKMTGQYDSEYGQDYDYTTTEKINGKEVTISSGVASYEPGIGSEENPFRGALLVKNKLPAASARYGAIETPVLENLFPSPYVGYSKVTIRSIHRNELHQDSVLRSAVGKQVTEFYTAKDFPVRFSYTPLKSIDYHKDPLLSFFNKQIIDRRTVSQGFMVETNDMHGKMKSQAAYSESDERTPLTASYYSYKNTGTNGFNDKVNFVYKDSGLAVKQQNMGIDVEMMNDVREFSVKSKGSNIQAQVDIFPIIFPFTIPTAYVLQTDIENLYRAVTCTKLINYHAILDTIVMMDKGSSIKTVTMAYDAETGSPLVSMTYNEFQDPVYSVNYPAWWAYSGMAPAYRNIGRQFDNVNVYDGKITSGADTTIFESGDELYVTQPGNGSSGCLPESQNNIKKLWAFDKNKNSTALTVPIKDIVFIDNDGKLYTKFGVSLRIVRSGKRNLLNNIAEGAVTMANPLASQQLILDNTTKTISANAVEYKEKWQVDRGVIFRKNYYTLICTNEELDSIDCNGILEKSINPYLKGLVGNYKAFRSYIYYGNRENSNVTEETDIRKNGYFDNFSSFWNLNGENNLVPNHSNLNWIWNSEITKINSKNQELETHDALDIYSAVQYGFNKSLPVAEARNSRHNEIFAENFEDYFFDERINDSLYDSCCQREIDFKGITNSNIVSSDSIGLNAHSGKYFLSVNSSSSIEKEILTSALPISEFSLLYKSDHSSQPDIGFKIKDYSTCNSDSFNFPTPYPSVNFGTIGEEGQSTTCSDSSEIEGYITVSQPGNFEIQTVKSYQISVDDLPDCYAPQHHQADAEFNFISIEVKVYDLNNVLIASSGENGTISLPSGTFHVKYTYKYSYYIEGWNYVYCLWGDPIPYAVGSRIEAHIGFNIYELCTGNHTALMFNKSLNGTPACYYHHPIPGNDSMLNPSISLKRGAKMLLSAWVKENCGIPCFKNNYDSTTIVLNFPGSQSTDIVLKPIGNIIEGWQKIEASFTVPSDASSVNLIFRNKSGSPGYYDDVRIQPFNATMKSYVYDPRTLKLTTVLDENNYATFYNYDEEGQLIRVKKETARGIETIKESRSSKQKGIDEIQ